MQEKVYRCILYYQEDLYLSFFIGWTIWNLLKERERKKRNQINFLQNVRNLISLFTEIFASYLILNGYIKIKTENKVFYIESVAVHGKMLLESTISNEW